MCLSPLHLRLKSVYPHPIYDYSSVTCSCGKCDECREVYRNEWVNRLCFEYDANKGGKCVFLTFTYNDKHLPVFTHGDFSCKCFNHQDVLTFLSRLEQYYLLRFPKKPYKYFFASEYGKNTQRPHYHCLFFLSSDIADDWKNFVEVCREIWSAPLSPKLKLTRKNSLHLGFMYPRLVGACVRDGKIVCGRYLDERGEDKTPLIQSGLKGMMYCSKYATKDLSFYSDEISAFLASSNGFLLKPYLPKHWQSNKLGYSAINSVLVNPVDAIENGIANPLALKKVPVPSYVINKLLYKNVACGRVSPTTNKPLYDRHLSEFGKEYLSNVFRSRVMRTAKKMSVAYQIIGVTSSLNKIGVFHNSNISDFVPLAVYHNFLKSISNSLLYELFNASCGSLSDLFDLDFLTPYYIRTKDLLYKQYHPALPTEIFDENFHRLLFDFAECDNEYSQFCLKRQKQIVTERLRKRLQSYDTKERLTHGFPNNLC